MSLSHSSKSLAPPLYLSLYPQPRLTKNPGQGVILSHFDRVLCVESHGTVREAQHVEIQSDDLIINSQEVKDLGAEKKTNVAPGATSGIDDTQLAEAHTDLRRKTGDWKIYSYYSKATGCPSAFLFVVSCLATAFSYQFSTIWVQWWSDASTEGNARPVGYYIGIYAVLCVGGLLGLTFTAWTMLVAMVSRSAAVLHNAVLRAVFDAPLSFFNRIDHGVTLNRFNQDMQLVDYSLPMAAINTFIFASFCLLQGVIISTSAKYMSVAIPFCILIIYFIQRFYLRTSRQLRLLDIEAKAPLCKFFFVTFSNVLPPSPPMSL